MDGESLPEATTPSPRAILGADIAVGLTALLARAAHLAALRATPFFPLLVGDARAYDDWGMSIAAGRWLGDGVFYQAPLYPYLLGILYSLAGHSPLAVWIVQALFGTAACIFVARAGRRFFDPATGLAAGLMLALYPTAIFFDGLIQKASLDLFLVAAFLLQLSRTGAGARISRWLGMGLVLGCLALTRENALALVAIALAAALRPADGIVRRVRVARAAMLGAGLACVLLPVGLRNLAVGGEFHLTTSQFGPNFFIGNGPQADGTYLALVGSRGDARFEAQDAKAIAERDVGRPLSSAEVSRYWTNQALRHIVSEPGAWLRLMLRKTLLLINRVEVTDTEDQLTCGDYSPMLRLLNPWFTFGLLLPLAGAGLLLTWRERRHLAVLYGYLGIYAASVLAFYVFSRYRFPLVPVLILFAAAALTGARAALRHRPRLLAVAGGAGLLLAVAANWPVAGGKVAEARATSENNIATALTQSGASAQSILPHLERAVALVPDFAAARRNLGLALRGLGKQREALDQFQRALALWPTADLHALVGLTLVDLGRPEEALGHYRQTVYLDPGDPENWRRMSALEAQLAKER